MKTKKLISILLCVLMMAAIAVPAMADNAKFKDVDNYWGKDEIYLVANAGIVGGFNDGTFRPNAFITREQFAKVVANFMGYTEQADISCYTDIPENDSLKPYLAMCVKAGVMSGTGETKMSPKSFITRQAAAAMLCRAFELKTQNAECSFTDNAKISAKLAPEVAAITETGIITGYNDGSFGPKKNLTRGQMMVIISRLLPANNGYFMTMRASAGDVTMKLDILDDYTTQFYLPDGTVDTSSVSMQGKIYGIPGLESISKLIPKDMMEFNDTFETGMDGKFEPKSLFDAAYDFNFASVKASVNNTSCIFNIYGKADKGGIMLTCTPTSAENAEKTLQAGMNSGLINIFALIFTGNNVTLQKDSYIQVGTEKIECPKELVIDLAADEQTITDTVLNTLELKTGVKNDGNQATIVIKSGSKIATEGGTLQLAKDVTIVINGASESFDGVLSKLKNMDASNIEMLTGLINEMIDAIEGNVVNVDVTIK